MEYRTLGQSDINVSELAFGAWAIGGWLWGGADSKEAIRAIETAIDNGMTTIDTAAVYGFGLSEELVGKATRGKRDRVQILTKFGLTWSEKKGEFFFDSQDNEGRDVKIYKYSAKDKVISDCDQSLRPVSYTHLRAHETPEHLVCRLLLEKKKKKKTKKEKIIKTNTKKKKKIKKNKNT